jgi:hypothetical protein
MYTAKSFKKNISHTIDDRHVRNEKLLRRVKKERNILQQQEGRLTGLVTSCVGTAFQNMLLKER